MLTERQFQQQVVDLAHLFGWMVYHTWNSKHSEKGYPDLHLIRPPRHLFAELKSEKGKLTREQQRWIEMLQECGNEVHVWRPRDFSTIVQRLSHGGPSA